jgi:nickel superoxide dismutase
MNRFASPLIRLIDRVAPPETVSAHCDIPCGIYDPHAAQIAALTVLRMNQLMEQADPSDKAGSNSYGRYVTVKEEHAEICKKELDILWHDYFKPEHLSALPNLHETFWNAAKLCSKNKTENDAANGEALMSAIEEIHNAFWKSKNREVAFYRANP